MKTRILFAAAMAGTIALNLFAGIAQAEENAFEALPAGVDAYIYGYPLVTMEMTRRVMTNVEKPEGHARADGAIRADARVSDGSVSRRDRPQRRHALHHGVD